MDHETHTAFYDQQIIEARRALYRAKLNRIWIESLVEPSLPTSVRRWIYKSNQYMERLKEFNNPADDHLIFKTRMTLKRLNRTLIILAGA